MPRLCPECAPNVPRMCPKRYTPWFLLRASTEAIVSSQRTTSVYSHHLDRRGESNRPDGKCRSHRTDDPGGQGEKRQAISHRTGDQKMVPMDRASTPKHDAYEAYMAYMGRGKGGAKTANGVRKSLQSPAYDPSSRPSPGAPRRAQSTRRQVPKSSHRCLGRTWRTNSTMSDLTDDPNMTSMGRRK